MAFDMGGMAGGAAGGAGLGTMIAPGIGTVLGGIGGGLLGAFGGKKGTGASFMEYNPDQQYRDSMMGLWNQNVGFDQDTLRNLQAGKLNSGMEAALQEMMANKKRLLYQQYYGNPGDRGSSFQNQAMEAAAIQGASPKSGMAAVGKLGNQYANDISSITDFYNQQKMAGLQSLQSQYGAGGAATNYKRSTATPTMQMISQGSSPSNPISSALGQLAGGFSSTGNIFNGSGGMGGGNVSGSGLFGTKLFGQTANEMLNKNMVATNYA